MMKKPVFILVKKITINFILPAVLFLLLFSSCNTGGSNNSSGQKEENRIILNKNYAEEIQQGRQQINLYLFSTKTPGLSVSVSIDGETVWSEGFGLANYELDAPARPQTKYLLGRSSQVFTTMLIAKLQEEGKLDIGDSFYKYFPDYPKKRWDFTVYQLGAYSAGFPQDDYNSIGLKNDFSNFKDIIELHKNDSLIYTPNTAYLDSDFGIYLLGMLAEKVGDTAYAKLVLDEIISPLGLEETSLDNIYYITKNRSARYYQDFLSNLINAPQIDYRAFAPSYGYLTTADELNKIGQSVLDTTFFSQKTLDLFFTPDTISDLETEDIEINRSFGWWISTDESGRTSYAILGQAIGGNSILIVYPEQKIVISLCSNKDETYSRLPAESIISLFLDKIDPGSEEE